MGCVAPIPVNYAGFGAQPKQDLGDERILGKKQELIKSFLSVGAMRLIALPTGLFSSIMLARFLGPEQFGQYAFIMALVPLLAIPITGGMQNLLTREVAAYSYSGQWRHYRGIVRAGHIWVVFVSALFLATYFVFAFVLDLMPTYGKWSLLPVGVLMIPLLGLNAARNGVIKGLGLPALAELPKMLLQPLIALLALMLVIYTIGLNPEIAIWIQVLSNVAILLIGEIGRAQGWLGV